MKNIYLDKKYFDYCLKNDLSGECDAEKIINSTIASCSMPGPKGRVFINLNPSEIKNDLVEPESSIFKYRQRFQQVNTNKWSKFSDEDGIIEEIKNKKIENIVTLGFSLFIIDIDEKVASEIRGNSGCMVFSLNEIISNIKIVTDEKTIVPIKPYQDEQNPKINCFRYLFPSIYNLNQNTNSILIMDPYLLHENNEGVIIKNLKSILEFILPTQLDEQVKMNIGIIVSRFKDRNKTIDTFKNKFQRKDSDLYKLIRSLKDLKKYKLDFQILFLNEHNIGNKKFHKRFILTKNYRIEFKQNSTINVFNTNNIPKFNEKIQIESIFNDELDEYDIDHVFLDDIKYLYEKYDKKVFDMIDQRENMAFTNPIFKFI